MLLTLIEDLEPRVLECLGRVKSFLRVYNKEFSYEVFAFIRNLLELFVVEVKVSCLDSLVYVLVVCSLEGQIP